jgi:hypothetical protein
MLLYLQQVAVTIVIFFIFLRNRIINNVGADYKKGRFYFVIFITILSVGVLLDATRIMLGGVNEREAENVSFYSICISVFGSLFLSIACSKPTFCSHILLSLPPVFFSSFFSLLLYIYFFFFFFFFSHHKPLLRVTAIKTNRGEVCTPQIFFLSLPVFSTLGGMKVRTARIISMCGLLILALQTIVVVHMMAPSGDLIRNKSDIEVFKKCGCVSLHSCSGPGVESSERDQEECHMKTVYLIHDIIYIFSLVYIGWTTCAVSAVNVGKYVNLLSANRSADLVLNHILKNSIAGAACMIEVDISESGHTQEEKQRLDQVNFLFIILILILMRICRFSFFSYFFLSSLFPFFLNFFKYIHIYLHLKVLNQLHRTMHWCTMRQVLIDLRNGELLVCFLLLSLH